MSLPSRDLLGSLASCRPSLFQYATPYNAYNKGNGGIYSYFFTVDAKRKSKCPPPPVSPFHAQAVCAKRQAQNAQETQSA